MNQPNEGMIERFDKRFPLSGEWIPMKDGKYFFPSENIKYFIQSEIDLALAKQRSQIVEIIESFMDPRNMNANTNGGNWYSGGQINDAHLTNRLCKDIISTITKDTKD
jgi:hypothetical protein